MNDSNLRGNLRCEQGTSPEFQNLCFRIRQITLPGVPNKFYATGSELFVKRRDRKVEFLHHGGHFWGRDWALANMHIDGRHLDINALEVASVPIPEPGSLVLASAVLLSEFGIRRRESDWF